MSAGSPLERSIRRHLIASVAVVALVGFGIGGWATTTQLAGAVIAPGQLVVDSNVKKVQHPTGGVVGTLNVRDGDRVSAGEVVLRLDDTQPRAQVQIIAKSLDELAVRKTRLEAERDDAVQMVALPDLLTRAAVEAELAQVIAGEQKLFDLRRTARNGQRSQLRERVAQLRQEIQGLVEQTEAKNKEIEFVKVEREAMRELWKKNLVPINRVTTLERDAVRIEGERGQLIAQTAQVRGKIAETELQIIQIDQDMRTEVGKELADIRAKTSELSERKVAAEDQLKRVDIRAPQDGQVFQLAVHTVGGVVNPAEPIMLVVPEGEALTVEVKVAPQDIDQLSYGQKAVLRFAAFNAQTTPEIVGEVSRISADLSQDQHTGMSYYTLRIGFSSEEAAKLGQVRLVPGMPVEAFVQTGERTALSYLMKPLSDQFMRAFRER